MGGSDRPCHGHGNCDGDGTRGGDGKCSCDHGYEGEFCLDCISGYFDEVRNDTFSLCTGTLQHRSAKRAAAGAPPAYFHIHVRKRVSRKSVVLHLLLQNATTPVKPALERPIRTVMSAKKAGRRMSRRLVLVRGLLKSLHVVYRKHSKDIRSVYTTDSLQCISCVPDINECSKDPSPCEENQYCLNTEGSYSCQGNYSLPDRFSRHFGL